MLQHTNLYGMTTRQLEQLRLQMVERYNAGGLRDEERDALARFYYTVCNCLPHTFVLWSLFEVEDHEEEIPDYVLEDDPLLKWIPYPHTEDEKWLQTTLGFEHADTFFTVIVRTPTDS